MTEFGYLQYSRYKRKVKAGKKLIEIARDLGFEINQLVKAVQDYERGHPSFD